MDSHKAWQTTVGHEITHVFEGTEFYNELRTAVQEYARRAGTLGKATERIKSLYSNIENADLDAELTAELIGEYLFTDEAFVRKLSTEHRNVFQKIYEEIKYLAKIVTAGSKEARQLEKVKHIFDKMYRESEVQKNTVKDGEVKYSISQNLESDLDSVLNGTFKAKNNEVYLGETSNFMTNVIGAESLSVTMPASKAYSALVTLEEYEKNPHYKREDNYHGIGKQDFMEILEKSENPIAAFADSPDANGNQRLNRIVLVTDKVIKDAETGKDGYAVVIEEVSTNGFINGKRVQANKAITIYPRTQIISDIQQAIADKRILNMTKKSNQLLAGVQGANSQGAIRETDYKNNIAHFWANVKWKNEKNKKYSFDSPTATLSPIEAALQKAGMIDKDGHVQYMSDSENNERKNSLSPLGDDFPIRSDLRGTPASELRYEPAPVNEAVEAPHQYSSSRTLF